jgi:hypothetical protein
VLQLVELSIVVDKRRTNMSKQDNGITKAIPVKRSCRRCGVELDSSEDLFCVDCVLLTSDDELWK